MLLIGWLLVFSPLLAGGTTHLAVLVIRLTILLLLALFLWRGIKSGAIALPSTAVGFPVLIYLALAILSAAASPYTHQSLQWLIVLFGYAALLYLLVSSIRTWNHVVQLLGIFIAMALAQAAFALVQHHWFRAVRPSGTFFNPNFLAGYLVAAWAVILGWVCYNPVWKGSAAASSGGDPASSTQGMRHGRAWLLAPVLLAVLLVAMVETASRGGMLALLVAGGFVVAARFKLRGVIVLCLVLLAIGMSPNPLRSRLQAEHAVNPFSYARLEIWRSSLQQMMDHPLGIGLGVYQYVYPRYAFPVEGQIARYGKAAHSSHSEYLQMGTELGWLSVVVFAWGVALVAREARRTLREDVTWWQRGILVGLCAAGLGILTHAAVDSNLHEPALAVLLVLDVAILLSARRIMGGEDLPARTIPLRSPAVWAGVGLAAIAGLTFLVLRMGLAWMAYEDGSRALAMQDVPGALDAYHRAAQLDSGVALYHSALAAAYFREFERTRSADPAQTAVRELRKAMELNPLDGRLPGLLGHVYAALAAAETAPSSQEAAASWRRAAVAAYGQAVALEPYTPFHRFELGRLYLALGERERAETAVRAAVELEPNFLPGREWLARLYLREGQWEAANLEYREIQERLQRYAHWAKDPVEERFLKADVSALAGALAKMKSPT